ncbi:Short-chain dehydrogenase/reductase family protein [Mycena chlorophos]|uniref:Short-chain dehydrogenase/reductase family protein n=1 Tax=Mycena chlorophos TaxID=658473 RepID=A0A8H6SC29_MYCCL|nr:Short-chain dehydrogenase/reductase family protein [Mycena chlorophos]
MSLAPPAPPVPPPGLCISKADLHLTIVELQAGLAILPGSLASCALIGSSARIPPSSSSSHPYGSPSTDFGTLLHLGILSFSFVRPLAPARRDRLVEGVIVAVIERAIEDELLDARYQGHDHVLEVVVELNVMTMDLEAICSTGARKIDDRSGLSAVVEPETKLNVDETRGVLEKRHSESTNGPHGDWKQIESARHILHRTVMDTPLHPPLRVTPLSGKPLTSKNTQKRLEVFLQDLQDRTTAAQGGQTTVTVQLEKLAKALKEEREDMKLVAGA